MCHTVLLNVILFFQKTPFLGKNSMTAVILTKNAKKSLWFPLHVAVKQVDSISKTCQKGHRRYFFFARKTHYLEPES